MLYYKQKIQKKHIINLFQDSFNKKIKDEEQLRKQNLAINTEIIKVCRDRVEITQEQSLWQCYVWDHWMCSPGSENKWYGREDKWRVRCNGFCVVQGPIKRCS